MQHSLANLRAKLDQAIDLAGYAVDYLKAQPMTVEFMSGFIARMNEITGVFYRLIQMHKTLECYEKNPKAAQNLESMFYALQNVIDNMVDDPIRRPPREPGPPTGTTPVLFMPNPAPRKPDLHIELRRIAPLPPIPHEAPAVPPNSFEAMPESNSATSDSSLESRNVCLHPASTQSLSMPASTSVQTPGPSGSNASSPAGHAGDNHHGLAAHLDSPAYEPRRHAFRPRVRPPASSAGPAHRLVSPHPFEFTNYAKFFSKIRPVAPLTLAPITRFLSGCHNFLTEFIYDTGVRLTIAIKIYAPELTQTLLPRIEHILFPPMASGLAPPASP